MPNDDTTIETQIAPAPHASAEVGDDVAENGTHNASFSKDIASLVSPTSVKAGSLPTEPEWQQCIQRTIDAIVSIRFAQVMAFDTDAPTTSEATGFIVDAKRGIILTNRHVVCAGPFLGEAILHNHEEVSVIPIYRDPVHDFGFLRFNPAEIKYMNLVEIPLDPRRARVGLDIRVVGNDAGEKLSILAGSISRLDRNAPDYGDGNYNDFNTFYLQAAASATGGSSGSPVIDIQGYAVGLQAGGRTNAATDYFLPLDRVKRALSLVQENKEIKRGTMEVQFLYKPFDETRRLGLTDTTEREIRTLFPNELGLLVVEKVLPKGPASELLEEGDVLISVNGENITKFVQLDEILDDGVGAEIEIVVERGGERIAGKVMVEDLHSITPDRLLECAGAVVTPLSYQLARAYSVPIKGSGVFLAQAWGSFDMRSKASWMILAVDNHPTPDFDSFVEVFRKLPDRKRVPVKHYALSDIHATFVKVVQVDRHWSGFKLWVRNDTTGLWDPTTFEPAPSLPPPTPSIAKFITLPEKYGPARNLIRSMVKVQYWMPFGIDGLASGRKNGAGLVVDAERGLVVTSRHLIPFALGDVTISFAESVVIPAEIIYQHPTHNIAFVRYDPKLVESTDVVTARISDVQLQSGDGVQLVAYNYYDRPIIVKTEVSDICSDVTIPSDFIPRWRSLNFDYIMLNTPLSQECSGGVLADDNGHVQGLWLTYLGDRAARGGDNAYYLGLDIRAVLPILEPLRADREVGLRCLNVEVTTVSVEDAREMGLSDEYVTKVQEANEERRNLFMVKRTETGAASAEVLKDLDVVLEINGKVITRMYEFDVQYNNEFLDIVVLREAQELRLRVPTSPIRALETSRIVIWSGGIFQEPHKAVRQQSKKMPSQVYLTTRYSGSPVSLYSLETTWWITAINGKSIETLDDFLTAVRDCPDNTYVRVKVVNFEMAPSVMSVKQNLHYWPTSEMVRDPSSEFGWRTIKH